MTSDRTHEVTFTATEVRKRFVSWGRGEADREWGCLTLLAEHAPDVAPLPLRRETDPDGSPVVVMSRLRGEPLGSAPLTPAQSHSLGRALRRTLDVSSDAVRRAGIGERIAGPSTLATTVAGWLDAPRDLTACQDVDLVRRGIDAARAWLAEPGVLPAPRLSCLGVADRKPANLLWDGASCRLVDLEDGGLSEPGFELADLVEHVANRLPGTVDAPALLDAAGLSGEERDRMRAYRPLWAAFWLAMLLPGGSGFDRNPPGSTEGQARHLLGLLGLHGASSGDAP